LISWCDTRGRCGIRGWDGRILWFVLVGAWLVTFFLVSELPFFAMGLGMGVKFLKKCLLGCIVMLLWAVLEFDVLGGVAFATTETTFLAAVVFADVPGKWVDGKVFGVGGGRLLVFLDRLLGW